MGSVNPLVLVAKRTPAKTCRAVRGSCGGYLSIWIPRYRSQRLRFCDRSAYSNRGANGADESFNSGRIGPDGTVISHLLWPHAADTIPDPPTDLEALDVLVRRAVNFENLRMEEATVSDLNTHLQRLEYSISLVKDAISQISSEPITPV